MNAPKQSDAWPGIAQMFFCHFRTDRTTPGPGVEVSALGICGLGATAGLHIGDIILSINGCIVSDHQTAIALLDSSERYLELVVADRPVCPGRI